ncbi:hypothetical protein [Rothia nasimurium]|uniref:hypothetical protein n=1 Tax=Rothia nasimurium TaxID=85336 RepID=UPI002DD69218|nr:hypothetical protein [Rothia nasimurium]
MKFSTRALSASSAALLSLTLLVGCGAKEDTAASSSASSSSSAAASASAAETSAAASESAAPAKEAVIPEGHKVVTASQNQITFAVPESWMELNAQTIAEIEEAIQAMIEISGGAFDAETFKQQVAALDLMAMSTELNAVGGSSVTVEAKPIPASSLPTKEELTPILETFGADVGEYSTMETSLGEDAQLTYNMSANGITVEGAYLIVPAGGGSGYSMIAISTSDAAETKALAESIANSLAAA